MVVSINNSSSGVNAQNLFNSKYFRTEDFIQEYFTLINTVKHFIPLYEYTPIKKITVGDLSKMKYWFEMLSIFGVFDPELN